MEEPEEPLLEQAEDFYWEGSTPLLAGLSGLIGLGLLTACCCCRSIRKTVRFVGVVLQRRCSLFFRLRAEPSFRCGFETQMPWTSTGCDGSTWCIPILVWVLFRVSRDQGPDRVARSSSEVPLQLSPLFWRVSVLVIHGK